MADDLEHSDRDEILAYLKRLDVRVSRLEEQLTSASSEHRRDEGQQLPEHSVAAVAEDTLELQIGQNWFAKVGIAVLTLGVVFLLTLPYLDLPPVVPSVLGVVLAVGFFALSYYLRESFPQTSRYILGGALLLLYVATLRLSRFSPGPAVESKTVELIFLLIVVAIDFAIAFRVRSSSMIALTLVLGYFTPLMYGEAFTVFALILTFCAVAVYVQRSLRFTAIPLLAIVLSYLTHAIWAMNNPFLGKELQLVSAPEANISFLLVYILVFGVGAVANGIKDDETPTDILHAVLNGSCSFVLLLLLTLTSFSRHIVLWQTATSVVFLILSMVFWTRLRSKYATFIYAMLGYAALSAAIVAEFKMPDSFVWLCWQAVLVLSTAVWFRSRFIVVANFIIYLVVFGAYLFTVQTVGVESLSFGIVALVSARILNWQKGRLELRTELMRNAYLLCALIVIPYTLYHSVPGGYVSLSWLFLALIYYLISRFLKNRKYRWMAILTTFLTILHVVAVDLVAIDPVLRVISFITLGSALLTISMFYSRRKEKAESRRSPVNF